MWMLGIELESSTRSELLLLSLCSSCLTSNSCSLCLILRSAGIVSVLSLLGYSRCFVRASSSETQLLFLRELVFPRILSFSRVRVCILRGQLSLLSKHTAGHTLGWARPASAALAFGPINPTSDSRGGVTLLSVVYSLWDIPMLFISDNDGVHTSTSHHDHPKCYQPLPNAWWEAN